MPCYHPIQGWRSRDRSDNGRRGIVFSPSKGLADLPVKVPCGQCIGCRLERSRQWAIRCYHEASLYSENCFITLTYDDQHLPADRSLHLKHYQDFMKRLRKKYGQMRFFHCGEYGEKNGRPHYHSCIFGFDFPDKTLWKQSDTTRLYVSQSLSDLWGHGYAVIGDVTFESAAYVARYITKKVTGKNAAAHYERVDLATGELIQLKPEYTTMSRRPGIGREWMEKFRSDVYPDDFVVINGKKMKPPKYYDRCFEAEDPNAFADLKGSRVAKAKQSVDNTPERLHTREQVQQRRMEKLIRPIEE